MASVYDTSGIIWASGTFLYMCRSIYIHIQQTIGRVTVRKGRQEVEFQACIYIYIPGIGRVYPANVGPYSDVLGLQQIACIYMYIVYIVYIKEV